VLLRNGGADVDILDDNNMTPLHLAASSSCSEVVELLFHYGVDDVNAVDRFGKTPLYYAVGKDKEFYGFGDIELSYYWSSRGVRRAEAKTTSRDGA